MFEIAEVGHEVSRKAYARAELDLRSGLLEAQRALREAGFPVILIHEELCERLERALDGG